MSRAIRSIAILATVALLPWIGQALAEPCSVPIATATESCELVNGVTVTAQITGSGQVHGYRVVVPAPSLKLLVELFELPGDYDLYLATAEDERIGQSVQEGTVSEQIELSLQAPGSYYVYVMHNPSRPYDADRPYSLRATLRTADGSPLDSAAVQGPPGSQLPPISPVATETVLTPVPQARVGRIYFSLDSDGNRRAETDISVARAGVPVVYCYYDFFGVTSPNTLQAYILINGSSDTISYTNRAFTPSQPDGWRVGTISNPSGLREGKYTLVVELNGREAARRDFLLQ